MTSRQDHPDGGAAGLAAATAVGSPRDQGALEHGVFFSRYRIWPWVKTYDAIFGWMNIHLPSILMFTRCQGFDPMPYNYHQYWIWRLDERDWIIKKNGLTKWWTMNRHMDNVGIAIINHPPFIPIFVVSINHQRWYWFMMHCPWKKPSSFFFCTTIYGKHMDNACNMI